MKLHNLKPAKDGASKKRKRLGRGHASGQGTQAGRGHKGQNARSGGGVRPGFEGGQLPLARRLPKRGFTNIFAKKPATINVGDLNRFEENAVVSAETLIQAGIMKNSDLKDGLKILGNGELEKPLTVQASQFSKSAREKIEHAGGKAEVI